MWWDFGESSGSDLPVPPASRRFWELGDRPPFPGRLMINLLEYLTTSSLSRPFQLLWGWTAYKLLLMNVILGGYPALPRRHWISFSIDSKSYPAWGYLKIFLSTELNHDRLLRLTTQRQLQLPSQHRNVVPLIMAGFSSNMMELILREIFAQQHRSHNHSSRISRKQYDSGSINR